MSAVREILISLGYDMEHYHQESFHAPAETVAEIKEFDDPVPDESAQAEIVFTRSGVTVTCTEGDTIMQIARAQGLPVASGCNFGAMRHLQNAQTLGRGAYGP